MQIKLSARLLILSLISTFAVSCSSPESFNDTAGKDRSARMTKAERESIAPNELFLAIVDGNLDEVKRLADSNALLLSSRNQRDQNTPLELAIQYQEEEIARVLLAKIIDDETALFRANGQGESLVFQASRAGWAWMIKDIADAYYRTLGVVEDYEFDDLDFPNTLGEKALHVARTSQVVLALQAEYYRGSFLMVPEIPGRAFMMATDNLSRTFVHTATINGRNEVLRWASDRLCTRSIPEEYVGETIGSKVNWVVRAYQLQAWDFGIGFGSKFNDKDEFGKTPLHYAAASRKTETLRALARCQYLDYDAKDNEGNNALQALLLSLDDQRSHLADEDLQSLKFIMDQVTRMAIWSYRTGRIDSKNKNEETSLHLAARLADPRPYEILKEFGNVELTNKAGQTAQEVFDNRRKRIGSNGN